MTFEEWWSKKRDVLPMNIKKESAEIVWHAAQETMRERAIECAQEHSCKTYHELCDCNTHIVKAIKALPVE